MTDTVVIHKLARGKVSADAWPTLDLRIGLLHETSTAAPAVDDEFVADLVPASNELVNDDYTRVALASLAATWNATTKLYELTADDVTWAAMTGATLTQGVKGYFVYVDVTDDSDSWLVRTVVYSTAETFNGSDYIVGWDPTGVLTVGV